MARLEIKCVGQSDFGLLVCIALGKDARRVSIPDGVNFLYIFTQQKVDQSKCLFLAVYPYKIW